MPSSGYNYSMGTEMYSTKQAAKELGLSPDHVKRLARDGVIEAKKLGRDWVVLSLDYERQRKPKSKRNEAKLSKKGGS